MPSFIELGKEMVFIREMNELLDILKKTAIAQFQSLFARKREMTTQERYQKLLEELFDKIDFAQVRHPLFTNPTKNVMVVLVTSDMGFLGGLNVSIIQEASRNIRRKDNVHFFVIGEKGRDSLKTEMDKDCSFLPGISNEIELKEAERASQFIFGTCIREKIGRVILTYSKFFSFAHQEIQTVQLLPRETSSSADKEIPSPRRSTELSRGPGEALRAEPQAEVISPDMPARRTDMAGGPFGKITYEPFMDKVVDYLVRVWLLYRLHDIFWHSKLSEFAVRANYLESSINELEETQKKFATQYFRSKREITDRTLRDIFGGRLIVNRAKLKKLKLHTPVKLRSKTPYNRG